MRQSPVMQIRYIAHFSTGLRSIRRELTTCAGASADAGCSTSLLGTDKVLPTTAPSLVIMRLSNTIRYERPHVRLTFGCGLRIDEDCLVSRCPFSRRVDLLTRNLRGSRRTDKQVLHIPQAVQARQHSTLETFLGESALINHWQLGRGSPQD